MFAHGNRPFSASSASPESSPKKPNIGIFGSTKSPVSQAEMKPSAPKDTKKPIRIATAIALFACAAFYLLGGVKGREGLQTADGKLMSHASADTKKGSGSAQPATEEVAVSAIDQDGAVVDSQPKAQAPAPLATQVPVIDVAANSQNHEAQPTNPNPSTLKLSEALNTTIAKQAPPTPVTTNTKATEPLLAPQSRPMHNVKTVVQRVQVAQAQSDNSARLNTVHEGKSDSKAEDGEIIYPIGEK